MTAHTARHLFCRKALIYNDRKVVEWIWMDGKMNGWLVDCIVLN